VGWYCRHGNPFVKLLILFGCWNCDRATVGQSRNSEFAGILSLGEGYGQSIHPSERVSTSEPAPQ
jgi:hypothetical protein